MNVILRKYGNSTVLVFPPAMLRGLGLAAGRSLAMTSTEDGSVVLTPTKRHSLEALVAQCDEAAAPPKDMALWDAAKPVGQEAW